MAANPSFRRRACQSNARLSKASFIALLDEGSRRKEFYEGLDDENWEIISFDPAKREVCVTIISRSTTTTTYVIVSDIVFS